MSIRRARVINVRGAVVSYVYGGRSNVKSPREITPGLYGWLGNPFEIGPDGNRAQVIEKFRVYFHQRLEDDPAFLAAVLDLKGQVLGCFCKPKACHLDIVVDWLNEQ